MIFRILKKIRAALDPVQWEKIEYFDESWRNRISEMALLIDDEKTVLDLGCGMMWLRDYLPAGCSYVPCDYVARSAETVVCDFNKKEFPDRAVDLCFVSGCLEYVEDVEWFLGRISIACSTLILSYCTTGLVPDREGRKALGWKNHMSRDCLVAKVESTGFRLVKKGNDVDGNEIMKFVKIQSTQGLA